MSNPNVVVVNSAGINCNDETAFAFEKFGANVEQVHMSQLLSAESDLTDFQILVLSGGFSDGDAIQSGRTLGLEIKKGLGDKVNAFVERGGLGIGICNGFQILTEIGLIPEGKIELSQPKTLSLVHNSHGKFVDNWQNLRTEQSKCLFAQPDDVGELIELPIANGEGRLIAKDTDLMARELAMNGLVVFRYCTSSGVATEDFPDNPSGSLYGITGVCDPSGQILGLMPHPERFIDTKQHPNWRRGLGKTPFGGLIIKKMVEVAREI